MSGVDPLAAVAAELAAMQGAGSDATLDLGAIAQILQTQLSVGELLAATVLPAKGGQDLIEILGQTVVAQLPPDVRPGETLLLQVTGFQGNQILVHNLGTQDPGNPVPTFVLELPPELAGSGATTATLTTTLANPAAPAPQAGAAAPLPAATVAPPGPAEPAIAAAQSDLPIAPSRAVFVAASVVPPPAAAPNVPVQAPPSQPAEAGAQNAPDEEPAANAAPLQQGSAGSRPAAPAGVSSQPAYVEARLAAARATTAERTLPPNVNAAAQAKPAPAAAAPGQRAAPAPPPPNPNTAALRESVFAKRITMPVMPGVVARATAPAAPVQPALQSRAAAAPSAAAQIAAAVASKEPVRILAALRVPATPVTLAAARLVGNATSQIATALQNLDRVLAQTQSADERLSTLQTMTGFIAKLDPRSEPAFAAQISSFVGNVVDGAETKLSQLLQALLQRGVHRSAGTVPVAQGVAGEADAPVQQPATGTAAPAAAQAGSALAPAHAPILAQARAAERQIAMTHDLKATLLSLVANPPAGQTPLLAQAMHDSLSALTAMQFNSLIAAQTDPQTIAFSIPVMFYEGGQAANIRISRESPKNKQRLDGDNFHIAFVLDTASLGTVAIDLETSGRSVKVNVKTDRASAVDRFTSSLGDLSARLEHLRYHVASTAAAMIGAAAAPAAAVPQHTMQLTKTTNVDLQA